MSETTTSTTDDAAAETSGDSGTTEQQEAATAESAAVTEGQQALGDAGKKALDAMKAERKAARDEAAALKAQLDALQAKVDGKEAEFAASQEAQRVKDEALAKANERIVGAELRAAAKGKVNEDVLSDLALFIKPSDFEVGDDGSVDADAIAQAIDDLITKRPSFAAQSGKKFQGSADGGARNDATKLAQLSEADMSRMTPEQIAEAHDKGQFDALISGS